MEFTITVDEPMAPALLAAGTAGPQPVGAVLAVGSDISPIAEAAVEAWRAAGLGEGPLEDAVMASDYCLAESWLREDDDDAPPAASDDDD